MLFRNIMRPLRLLLIPALFSCVFTSLAHAQTPATPITSQELVRLVYQLPSHPEKRDEVIDEIRKRGIGFPLTDGMRSVVASKSGNDSLLRRTLEEAERRRVNPVAASLPPEAESTDLLQKTRVVTLAASEAMPDFIVKQQITRSRAFGTTNNWVNLDRLTIAVSYRASAGEEYKLLAINGLPPSKEIREGNSYEEVGGTSSTGEYVTMLALLFKEETHAEFKPVDTDTLHGRRTIIYEFEVKLPYSKQVIKAGGAGGDEQSATTGYRGRIWVDRETYRVLRIEDTSTDIPPGFPVTAASTRIDYDWVTINEHPYLLPSEAEIKLTATAGNRSIQTRNEIRFRNYQKYGAEVKIIEDIGDDDEPPKKDDEPPKKP